MNVISNPSPNFDARDPAVKLAYIVLHYTGMKTGKEALDRLCDPASKVSAHYLIEEDGRIFQLVADDKRAWHAGKSSWRGVTDINSASIGIELVNPGHQFGYRKFPKQQITALKELLRELTSRHQLDGRKAVIGHADVAPERKEDPGELFPWEELASASFGLWPKVESSDYATIDDGEVQTMLRALGYDCPTTGVYDRATRFVLLAFQRHYEPANLTGTPEVETVARLRAVTRLLRA